jgi:CheY-like chemotaxis protein
LGARASLDTALLQNVQILVVDDDESARELLHAVLEYCGAHVTSAGSARGALASLDRMRPDVILCDILMPGADGYAFIRALGTRRAVADTPVIALTAFASPEAADGAYAAGFRAYLKKPVDPWALCRTIDRVRRGIARPGPAA